MGLKAKYETGVVLVIWENGGGRKGRKLELLRATVPRKSQTKKRSREPGVGKMAQQSRAPASFAEDPRGVPSTSLVALKHLLFKFQRFAMLSSGPCGHICVVPIHACSKNSET